MVTFDGYFTIVMVTFDSYFIIVMVTSPKNDNKFMDLRLIIKLNITIITNSS